MKINRAPLIAWVVAFALPATAASLQITNDPSTGAPGKFAEEEIHREAAAKTTEAQITLTAEKKPKAAAQSYRIKREGQKLTVIGADPAGAMYGGLDIAETIRIGYVDITAITEQVATDVEIARAWKPGTLKDDGKRTGAEKGFKQ